MENLLKSLNEEQLKAVKQTNGPLLIVAGAGTGKTTVLAQRLAYLFLNKIAKPEEVLVATFTEKAAKEMEERADKILPYGYVDLWISTFHAFCERILRDHALDIGLGADFKLLTQTDQWIFIRRHLDEFDLDYYRPLGNPTKFIHEIIRHFSRLKDENITPAEYLDYANSLEQDQDAMLSGASISKQKKPKSKKKSKTDDSDGDGMEVRRIQELANAYHVYNQLLLDNSYLDFGDLISYTLKLFQTRPNILKFYQDKFKYIMVDEFQDTNWAQYELIKMLARPRNNLTVVGDDDQSIYRFRGASMSNIMQFKDDYPGAQEIVLVKNYRSGQTILDRSYNFIKHNDPNRLEAKLKINKQLAAQRKGPGAVEHWHFAAETQETAGVIDKIAELYSAEKETGWNDFAILVRANDTAEKFIAELTRRNIPNQFVSLKGLYYKTIIMDIMAYLRLLDNYHESASLFRVLNMEVFKVGYGDIVEINKFARHKVWSMFEALKNIPAIPNISPEAVANINTLMSLVAKHSQVAAKEKASRVYVHFVYDSGLLKHLDHDKDKEIFGYLNHFYQKIKKLEEADPQMKLKGLIDSIEMEMEAGDTGQLPLNLDDAEAVSVMTVHAAKGLEFKYVFIVNLVDKKFPTISRGEKISIPTALVREKLPDGDTHIEEERRLFYVALTRARDGLFLTSAADYGGAREKKPSAFILEAGVTKQEIKNEGASKIGNELLRDMELLSVEEDAKTVKYQLPEKFSFSQIEAFSNCPLQYKYNFILKIPQEEKVNFIFGRVMHNTLRDFLSPLLAASSIQPGLFGASGNAGKKMPTRENLLKIYDSHWINEGYHSRNEREKYQKKGKEILNNFYDQLEADGWPQVMFIEKNFTLKIANYVFKGAIDRIDRQPDGSVQIIDYKTGKPKDKLAYDDKRQLLLYQIAAEEVFGLKVGSLAYYYLENGTKAEFTAKPADLEKVRLEVIATIEEIKKAQFVPKPGFLCAYCDFRNICEFREK